MSHPQSCLLPTADEILISLNPKAGAQSSVDRVYHLVKILERKRFRVEILTDLDEVARRANLLHGEGRLRTLVGVGGDGTAAELVNRTVPGVPLTLFAAGNENLLARYLGLDRNPEACCQAIVAGNVLHFDAGKAGERIFLLMAGCGFDGEVVRRVHSRRKGHISKRSYCKPILESIRNYDYPELRIYWGSEVPGAAEFESPPMSVRWLFAFNLPCYGGGLQISPEADGSDGLLDICTFRRGGIAHGLWCAATILLRQHHWMADFATRRVRRLRVTSEAKVPYQLDGDPGGFLPVDIEVVSRRLTLVVPEGRTANPCSKTP